MGVHLSIRPERPIGAFCWNRLASPNRFDI